MNPVANDDRYAILFDVLVQDILPGDMILQNEFRSMPVLVITVEKDHNDDIDMSYVFCGKLVQASPFKHSSFDAVLRYDERVFLRTL